MYLCISEPKILYAVLKSFLVIASSAMGFEEKTPASAWVIFILSSAVLVIASILYPKTTWIGSSSVPSAFASLMPESLKNAVWRTVFVRVPIPFSRAIFAASIT